MIIMVRGNHGAGKSWAVRGVMKQMGTATPIYGYFGPKMPEAYCCLHSVGPRHVKGPPLFILGPYESGATSGCDYLTKRGVDETVKFLERYRQKGDILFESIMTSVRIMEPSIGKWIKANKKDIVIATLTTTFEECEAAIKERKARSVVGHRWNGTHLTAQQRMFERVTQQYTEMGYRMEYVSREAAPDKIIGWLR